MVYINDEKIDPSKKVDFVKAQIVYIPLVSSLGYKYECNVKIGDYVCIGDILGINKVIDFPLKSSVSGTVVDFKKKYISNGELVLCIVIENDFKERSINKVGRRKNINNYSINEFLYKLRNNGITGTWMDDYPSVLKYETNNKINNLIINGVECDIYSSSDSSLMYNYTEEILEGIDAILSIMNISNAYIAISESNKKVINKFLKYINTYPNIKIYLIEDGYPNGWERYLVKEILGVEYKENTLEVNTIVNNVSTIYAIYETLKSNKYVSDRIVTITGNGVKNKGNYQVKIGTELNELMQKIDGYKNKQEKTIIVGGGMMGNILDSDEVIITKEVNTIIVNEKKEKAQVYPCIRCGKCGEVCPVNIIPALILEDKCNNKKELLNSCINCGLCSYVCPSKIDVREEIKRIRMGDKNDK